jgi:hypothetical protein
MATTRCQVTVAAGTSKSSSIGVRFAPFETTRNFVAILLAVFILSAALMTKTEAVRGRRHRTTHANPTTLHPVRKFSH